MYRPSELRQLIIDVFPLVIEPQRICRQQSLVGPRLLPSQARSISNNLGETHKLINS